MDTGYKYLNAHDILDLKELTNENNCSFKHNIAKNCKFSKCRTILLSNTEPQSMTLFSYDKETRLEKVEVVPLADEKWPIATMETAEEFKLHYLTKTVKNEERRSVLLPKLTDMKFGPLLPKKNGEWCSL